MRVALYMGWVALGSNGLIRGIAFGGWPENRDGL